MKIISHGSIIIPITFLIFIFVLFVQGVQSQTLSSCGTIVELEQYLGTDELVARPILSGPESIVSTPHFKIHYTLSNIDSATVGRDDSTTQAWAESVAVFAETSWVRSGRLGWTLPPPDGTSGGDSTYDIYIGGIGYKGITHMAALYPSPYETGRVSFIEIKNDLYDSLLQKFALLRAVVAHDFLMLASSDIMRFLFHTCLCMKIPRCIWNGLFIMVLMIFIIFQAF
jgi:hypothetical protein